jgi:hypothetical protein
MAKTTRKVKAKKFVEDFLSGMGREELMRAHDLSAKSMDKLLHILVERGVLAQDQIDRRFFGKTAPTQPAADLPALPERPTARRIAESSCPQCGAEVSAKSLTCPECGHLLSGAERWGALKEEKTILQRLPPWLIGCVIATPAAVLVVYVFAYLLYPMIEAVGERKAQTQRAQRSAEKVKRDIQDRKTPDGKKEEQSETALIAKRATLEREIHALVQRRIFAGPDESYRSFQAGSAWNGLSEDQKYSHLARIRTGMQQAELPVDFEIRDLWGSTVARVTEEAVIVGEISGSLSTGSSSSSPQDKPEKPKVNSPDQGRDPEKDRQ